MNKWTVQHEVQSSDGLRCYCRFSVLLSTFSWNCFITEVCFCRISHAIRNLWVSCVHLGFGYSFGQVRWGSVEDFSQNNVRHRAISLEKLFALVWITLPWSCRINEYNNTNAWKVGKKSCRHRATKVGKDFPPSKYLLILGNRVNCSFRPNIRFFYYLIK